MTAPTVSVVVPMLNERQAIGACLDGFAAQAWPLDHLEVIVVDGGSTDGAREYVEARALESPWIRLVDNPRRRASAAFNRGVAAAKGEVLCLFSAHGVPDERYVPESVRVLDETGAAGVGGVTRHEGADGRSAAIGAAMMSPFGMASPARYASDRREVDTLLHPAYRTDVLRRYPSPFDESLERNSDYVLNWKLRRDGHRLVFDPGITSSYRPRSSFQKLARQFWDYGFWKEHVIREHPSSLHPRHLVAPSAVVTLAMSPLLVRSRSGRGALTTALGLYAVGVSLATTAAVRRAGDEAQPVVVSLSFPIMHAAWGAGFLFGLIDRMRRRGTR